jgi:hypothetical protein
MDRPSSAMMPTVLAPRQEMAQKPLPPLPKAGGSYTLSPKGTAWLPNKGEPPEEAQPDDSQPSPTAPVTEA